MATVKKVYRGPSVQYALKLLGYRLKENPIETDFDDVNTDLLDDHEYLEYFESIYGPCKREWPNLVGDVVERATCIIKWATPFYVEVHEAHVARKTVRQYNYEPLRVMLFVDKNGFIARTPRVG